MVAINAYKEDLKKLIHIINSLFQIDVAIFDLNSRLLVSTEAYLQHKGSSVHTPSIDEVIANGNVMVNKPGHMPTCRGCRFIGKCPAKIELLRSIRSDTTPIGVMTFTSFSQKGHDRITREIKSYVDTLKIFSDWIAQLITQKHLFSQRIHTELILENLIDLCGESILAIDFKGTVIQCNPSAQNLFSFCDLYTRSIYHILPESIVDKILEGNILKDTRLIVNNSPAYLSARPLSIDNQFNGAVLSIQQNKQTDHILQGDIEKNATRPGYSLSSILGDNNQIKQIKKTITKLYKSDSTILINGETGTGKGLLAKVIHANSSRAAGPFVTVNCTSIPETLFESELFGYEEGAFTGAKKGGKPGQFELAQGGTLFLDEIGEMPLHMQVKLLNVLQDYSFQRVGGISPIVTDVRIIAATNQDLDEWVHKKKFRSDLYYRLNVIPMDLPSLADRKEDIRILATAFLKDANKKTGKHIRKISDPVMALLESHAWPGNIRELQNIIEYSINLEETDIITLDSLPKRFLNLPVNNTILATTAIADNHKQDIKSKVLATEIDTILSSLDRHGHDVRGKNLTAGELGISLRTLYRKLKQHDQKKTASA